MSTTQEGSKKGTRKKIIHTLGNILMILALVFIVRRLWIYRESLTETVNAAVIAVIIVSVFLFGGLLVNMLFAGVCMLISDSHVRMAAMYSFIEGMLFLTSALMLSTGKDKAIHNNKRA